MLLSCSLGLSPQHKREDRYASSSSSPLTGAAALTCFSPAPDKSQWWLSSHFRSSGPQSLAIERTAPIYEGISFHSACLVGCHFIALPKGTCSGKHLSAVKLRKSKEIFFFPVWMNKSLHSHNLPYSLVSELWTASTTPAKNWMYNAC